MECKFVVSSDKDTIDYLKGLGLRVLKENPNATTFLNNIELKKIDFNKLSIKFTNTLDF